MSAKDKIYQAIAPHIKADEELIGYFMGMVMPKVWLSILIGPLNALTMKHYYIAVTSKGVYFLKLNLAGKPTHPDFMTYEEIHDLKLAKKGLLQQGITFEFNNGRKLFVKAARKGAKEAAILDDATLDYLMQHI